MTCGVRYQNLALQTTGNKRVTMQCKMARAHSHTASRPSPIDCPIPIASFVTARRSWSEAASRSLMAWRKASPATCVASALRCKSIHLLTQLLIHAWTSQMCSVSLEILIKTCDYGGDFLPSWLELGSRVGHRN